MADNPGEAVDIFVSYSRLDRPWVHSLVGHFEAMGLNVWWDRDLVPGDEFDDEIDERLTSARAVIVVWSKNSVGSSWVKAEANEARELGILVPVLKDESRPPLVFRRYQTEDLSAWDGSADDPGFSSLMKAIIRRAKGSAAAARPAAAPEPPSREDDAPASSVEVGAGLEAPDLEVGEVVGEELEGVGEAAGADKVDLFRNAKLRGAKIDKITGRSIRGGKDEDEPEEA